MLLIVAVVYVVVMIGRLALLFVLPFDLGAGLSVGSSIESSKARSLTASSSVVGSCLPS